MVAQTKAEVVFTGSGNLGSLVEKLNKNIQTFGKSTLGATKNLTDLNKNSETSDKIFAKLAKSVVDTQKGFLGLANDAKKTSDFFIQTSKRTIDLEESLDSANKGVTGLGLRFLGLRDETRALESVLEGPAGALLDIAEAGSLTEKVFVALSKVAKPLRIALNFIGEQLEKVSKFFLDVEIAVVSLVKKGITVAVKSITMLSNLFGKLAESAERFGQVGALLSNQFSSIQKGLDGTASSAEMLSDNLDPDKLERVDSAGNKLSQTFGKLSNSVGKAATGVLIGGAIGSLITNFTGLGDKLRDTKDQIQDTFQFGSTVIERTGGQVNIFGNKLLTTSKLVTTLGNIFKNDFARSIGLGLAQVNAFLLAFQGFKAITTSLVDAGLQASGVGDAFAQMQALGIDTSAAEIAFQFGIVGEKLLFSAEAAKEFGRQSVASFARLEQAASFVTTLSTGANIQFENLGAGTQSVAAFTRELANSLDNNITSLEASEALYQSLSAGIGVASDGTADLNAQQKFLESSLKLSSGTGANAAQTLNLLSKTTTVYGLSANDAAITASKLNQVVEQGVTTFSELASSAPDVIPVAQSLGISLDEALASIAGLTRVSPSTAEATTGLASLLSAIAGQGAQAQKEISELGIQFDANTVRANGLNAELRKLIEATGGNQEVLKRIIPDQLAFRTAIALTGAASEGVESTLASMSDEAITSGEALDTVFGAGTGNLIARFTAITNGFNEVLANFGQRTLPALEPGIAVLENLLDIFRNLPEPLQAAIGTIVLAQTALSNFGGAALSIIKTVAQLGLSYVAFRLLSKALSGQLGTEVDVIKQLVVVEKDWAGALLRLIGRNEQFSAANIQLTKSINQSKDAFKALQREGVAIDLPDGQIENFQEALEMLRRKKEQINASPLRVVDPVNFQSQIASITDAEKKVNKAIASTRAARKLSLQEIQGSIDKALSNTKNTTEQRVGQFQELIKGLVSPQLVKGQSEKLSQEIDSLFRDTLTQANMTAEEKVGRIADTFRSLRQDAGPSLAAYLNDIERELLSGFGRIESQTQMFQNTLNAVSIDVFQSLPDGLRQAYNEAVQENKEGLLALDQTLSERKQSLANVFKELLDALPEEARKLRGPLANEFTKLLDDSRGTITARGKELNIAFAKLVKGLPQEIVEEVGAVKVAANSLVQAIEAPLAGRQPIKEFGVRAAVGLKNFTQDVEAAKDKANMALKEFAGPDVQQKVRENLDSVGSEVRKQTDKIEKSLEQGGGKGSKAFSGLSDSLDGLSGLLAGVSPKAAQALDSVNSFFASSRDLASGTTEVFGTFSEQIPKLTKNQQVLTKATQTYGGSLGQVSRAVADTTKKQGIMAGVQKALNARIIGSTASTNAFSAATVKAAGSTTVLSTAGTGISKALAGVGIAAKTATLGLSSFIVAAAPFVALGAAIAAAGFVLVRVFQQLIPASNQFADGNRKLAFSLGETNKELRDSLGIYKRYKDNVDGLRRGTEGATLTLKQAKDEIAGLNDELEESSEQLEEVEKVQGVVGAIINATEGFIMFSNRLIENFLKFPAVAIKAISDVAARIPIIGKAFELISKRVDGNTKDLEGAFARQRTTLRNFTNDIRSTTQDFLAAGIREEVSELNGVVNNLVEESLALRQAQQNGQVVTDQSKELVEAARERERALTSSELDQVIKNEADAAKLLLQINNETVASIEEKIEKTNDPVALTALQQQKDAIDAQNSSIEEGILLTEKYFRNINAIASTVEANEAARNQERLNQALQNTVDEIRSVSGDEAVAEYLKILNIVEKVNEETGEIELIRESTVNNASQAGRRAQAAIESTTAKIRSSIESLGDPDAQITQDILAQDLFSAIEAVQKGIAEDPRFAENGKQIIENLLNQDIDLNGVQKTLRDALTPQQLDELLAAQNDIVEKSFERRTSAARRSIETTSLLQQKGDVTALEAAQANAEAQEKIDQERLKSIQERLQNEIRAKGENSASAQSIRQELAQFELQIEVNRVNERRGILEEELNLLRAQKDNELQILKNSEQEQLNTIQLSEKANQQEQKALSSRQNLVKSIGQFEETILQNRLKLTGDVEEKAEIQVQLAEQRIELSEMENEFERQNIILQQELNSLALERESIQLRIQAAEAQTQIAANEAKLAKVDELNLTKEEEEALRLQNDSLSLQVGLLNDSQVQLAEFGERQETINNEQLEALDLRQRAQKEAASVDLELAQRNRVLATYDKEIQRVRNVQRAVEISSQERQVNIDRETSLLEGQSRILEEQQRLLEGNADIVQRNFQIAINAERNEFRKRRLEEEAARARLKALETQQQIEETIFRINEQQRDLALEVRQIELAAAREKAAADLAVAEAEAAKVAADPTSSEEEKQAAQLNIRAAEAQLNSAEAQQVLVAQERSLNAQNAGLRELQFQQQQNQQLREAEFAVAQTTRRRSDDRQIAQAALQDARSQQSQFNQLAQTFLNPTAINARSPQALGPAAGGEQRVNGDLNVNINVNGSTEGLDQVALRNEVKNATVQSWNQFIDEVRRRN